MLQPCSLRSRRPIRPPPESATAAPTMKISAFAYATSFSWDVQAEADFAETEATWQNGRLLPDLCIPPGGSHTSFDSRSLAEASSRRRNARSVEARRDFSTHEFEEHANAPSVVKMLE